jgi:endonuclease III
MSQRTAKLMGRPHRRGPKRVEVLREIADRLLPIYGTPTLGNFDSPVKEIFYILLSARTTEILYQSAHRRLFERFTNIEGIAAASPIEVFDCIGDAGLGRRRSDQIIQLAKRLCDDFGSLPDLRLADMTEVEAYQYLTTLPGVGPKSAFCVMMYSLGFDVFPVDVNVQRIAERIGIIQSGLKHYQAQESLPKFVPDGRSRQLHISLVAHGRDVCTPKTPRCGACVLVSICAFARKNRKDKR